MNLSEMEIRALRSVMSSVCVTRERLDVLLCGGDPTK